MGRSQISLSLGFFSRLFQWSFTLKQRNNINKYTYNEINSISYLLIEFFGVKSEISQSVSRTRYKPFFVYVQLKFSHCRFYPIKLLFLWQVWISSPRASPLHHSLVGPLSINYQFLHCIRLRLKVLVKFHLLGCWPRLG